MYLQGYRARWQSLVCVLVRETVPDSLQLFPSHVHSLPVGQPIELATATLSHAIVLERHRLVVASVRARCVLRRYTLEPPRIDRVQPPAAMLQQHRFPLPSQELTASYHIRRPILLTTLFVHPCVIWVRRVQLAV